MDSTPTFPGALLSNAERNVVADQYVARLGISRDAALLYLDSEVVDLHVDSFIWTRLFGYDLHQRHKSGIFGRAFYGQVDFPRCIEAQLKGGVWIITTNPLRTRRGRVSAFRHNLARLETLIENRKRYG